MHSQANRLNLLFLQLSSMPESALSPAGDSQAFKFWISNSQSEGKAFIHRRLQHHLQTNLPR